MGGLAYYSREQLPRPSFPDAVVLDDARFPPCPRADDVPGSPVWVIRPEASARPSWSDYVAELLRMEGFSPALASCSPPRGSIPASLHTVVLRPGCSSREVDAWIAWAGRGGTLVAFAPDRRAGMWPAVLEAAQSRGGGASGGDAGEISDAGMDANGAENRARAPEEPLPRRWSAWPFSLEAAGLAPGSGLAARQDRGGDEILPPFIRLPWKKGIVWMWRTDPAPLVARMRQGDSSLSDRRGLLPYPCPADLLQHDFDPARYALPVADLHAHVLAEAVSDGEPPLPAFWPFPSPSASALVMTGDQDFAPWEMIQFELDRVEDAGGEMTLYLTGAVRRRGRDPDDAAGDGNPSPDDVQGWKAMHHGLAPHPNYLGIPQEPKRLASVLSNAVRRFRTFYGTTPRTLRHHFVRWWGYVDVPRVEAALGILMDCNYSSIYPGYSGYGYLSGAGLPLPFADDDGALVPVFQQPTQIEDGLLVGDYDFGARLDPADALARAGALIREADAHATVLTMNFHPLYAVKNADLLIGLLRVATEERMPILSAERWLAFVLRRYASTLNVTAVGDGAQRIDVNVIPKRIYLRIPVNAPGHGSPEVRVDGRVVAGEAARKGLPLSGILVRLSRGLHRVEIRY